MSNRQFSRRSFVRVSAQTTVLAGLTLAGCGGGALVDLGPLDSGSPSGRAGQILHDATLAFDASGVAYRLDFLEHTVARLSSSGDVIWQLGGIGADEGVLNFPVALASDGNERLYVADRGNGEVEVLDPQGTLLRTLGRGQLLSARDLAVDPHRQLIYVCDAPAHRVAVFDPDGNLVRTLGEFGLQSDRLNFPTGVAVARNGNVHIVDSGNAEIQVHDPDGNHLFSYGGRGDSLGQFSMPRAVVIDSKGRILIADGISGFITVFNANGQALTQFRPSLAGGASVSPLYLAMGPSDSLVVSGPPAFVPA